MTSHSPYFQALKQKYDAYVDTFREADGKLPVMCELKREHTEHVLENARAIAAGEGFLPDAFYASEAAALLHDTGRYEQLKRYNTFRDSESVDHAVFSHDIVVEKGWLKGRPESEAILKAVLYHNRRDIPAGLDDFTQALCKIVRDADKLDIFRVLEHQVKTCDWKHDCRAFWNLPVAAAPNSDVIAAIREGRPVDYQNIKSLADFVLIQIGWIKNGLEYETTRRLACARGHAEFRRNFLNEICGYTIEI